MGRRTYRPRHLARGWRRRAWVVLALGPLVAGSWAGAYAAFTDSVATSSTFSTGTVDIQADGSDGPLAFTALDVSGLLPGNVKYAKLVISNAGTSAVTYGMAATTSGSSALAGGLSLAVNQISGSTCDAAAFTGGTTVQADTLGLGNAGWASRPLSVSGSETLCFKLRLPSSAPNTLQGTSATATFTFTAAAS